MSSRVKLLVLPTVAVLVVAGLAYFGPGSTAQAQDLSLASLGSERLTDRELQRGATVVVVWASWSPKCRNIVQRVNAIERQWGSKARVVTVDFQEDRSEVESFLAGKNLSAPVFLDSDGAFSKKYAVTTLPGMLVFKDGSAAYRGKLPDDPNPVLTDILG